MKRINSLLKQKSKTKTQAANEIGCSRQWFTQVVNGKKIPGRKMATRISEYFDGKVTPSELMQIK